MQGRGSEIGYGLAAIVTVRVAVSGSLCAASAATAISVPKVSEDFPMPLPAAALKIVSPLGAECVRIGEQARGRRAGQRGDARLGDGGRVDWRRASHRCG